MWIELTKPLRFFELEQHLGVNSLAGYWVKTTRNKTVLIGHWSEYGIADSCDCCTSYFSEVGEITAYRKSS